MVYSPQMRYLPDKEKSHPPSKDKIHVRWYTIDNNDKKGKHKTDVIFKIFSERNQYDNKDSEHRSG